MADPISGERHRDLWDMYTACFSLKRWPWLHDSSVPQPKEVAKALYDLLRAYDSSRWRSSSYEFQVERIRNQFAIRVPAPQATGFYESTLGRIVGWKVHPFVAQDNRMFMTSNQTPPPSLCDICGELAVKGWHVPEREVNADLLDAMKVILAGFDKGIFVRNVSRDDDPMCLLATAVQLAALAKGQAAVAKAENAERAQPQSADAVDPPGDSNTGNTSTRENSSS